MAARSFSIRCSREFIGQDKQNEMTETPNDPAADPQQIIAELQRKLDERSAERDEATAQQAATAEVLKVISRSAFDFNMVTTAILQAAAQLCRAPLATLHLRDGDVCRLVTQFGLPEAFERVTRDNPIPARYPLHSRRQVRAGEFAQYTDAWSDSDYLYKAVAKLGGYRAIIVIPMMREDELVGIFSLARPEPEPFTPGQIKLVQTFADQAAIAIENARLFNEVQARTRDLSEALQMQTATSDVLKVISRSAFDLQAVFNTLVSSAVELGGALTGTICVRDGDVFRYRDTIGAEHTSKLGQYLRDNPAAPGRSTIAGRVLLSGEVERIPDCLVDPEYVVPMGSLATNVRSLLGVPLLRNEGVEGAIILTREEPGHFTDRQVEIVQIFADQAVIALENVRLFEEVQAKTRDLSEALVYQAGSGNILKVIASSPTDVVPVLKAIVESACDLCEAHDAHVLLKDGDKLRSSAHHGPIPVRFDKLPINRNWVTGRAFVDKAPIHVYDLLGPEGEQFPLSRVTLQQEGYRTVLSVPMLREGESVGVIVLRRTEVHPFSEKQIVLLQTFANQAVIAIGNVRLFEQVQERTNELSLTLDNLRTAQGRLIQTEKLASLGQLTAGIAHEIKNPLNFVNNFSALSAELTDELNDVLGPAALNDKIRGEVSELTKMLKDNLEKVVQHGKRADSIVKNMLLHSREGSSEHRAVEINTLLDESLNFAYHGARAETPGFK